MIKETPEAIARDVYTISLIEVLPMLLEVLCDITGMGSALVARMSEVSWTVCAVADRINLGLKVADQLLPESTLCSESKRTGEPIVIDHVSRDPRYDGFHAPKAFGIESYISVPILLPSGHYFGNLCAVDLSPAKVSSLAVINIFQRFAALIAVQLASAKLLDAPKSELPTKSPVSEGRDAVPSDLRRALTGQLRAIRDATDAIDGKSKDSNAVKGLATRIRTSAMTLSQLLESFEDLKIGSSAKHGTLMPELPLASPVDDQASRVIELSGPMDRLALESLLMQRVGELNAHLGRYDMYALTIQKWLQRGEEGAPGILVGERATVRTRGALILTRLRSLAVDESLILEFSEINRQMIDVLDRQEIVAQKGAAIPSLQPLNTKTLRMSPSPARVWFDHSGAQATEFSKFIAEMERDISTVASLYIRLAGWAGRLSSTPMRH